MVKLWRSSKRIQSNIWDRLHRELKEDTYRPEPVRQVAIPKAGKPGEFRPARHSDDLRSGMSTSVAQSVGIDLRTGIR